MYKCDAHRFFDLKLGHVAYHGLYAFDFLVHREGGVVVVFEVHKQRGGQESVDGKVNGVFPVDINGYEVVVAAFYVIVESVEHRAVFDVLTYGLLVVDAYIDT